LNGRLIGVTGGTAGKIAGFKKKNLLSSKIYALPYMQQLAINVCMNEWHVTLERSVVVFSCLVAPFCVKASSVFHVYLSCVFCSFHSWGGHLLVENINVYLLPPLIKHLLLLSFVVFFFSLHLIRIGKLNHTSFSQEIICYHFFFSFFF